MRLPSEKPPDHAISTCTISTAPRPDQLAESIEAEFGLIAGDRRMQRVRHPCAALDIVRLDRLLDPVEVVRLHRAAHLDRERRTPGAVDIDHQLRLRPERPSHRRDPRQILARIDLAKIGLAEHLAQMRLGRGIAADLHLHALEAAGTIALGLAGDAVHPLAFLVEAAAGIGLDPVAAGAEQPIDRHLGDFAGNVPQRDVDPADRLHHDAAPAVLPGTREHLLPQPLDQQRVLADQQRLQGFFDDSCGGAAAEACLADADRAVIGFNLDEQRAALRPVRRRRSRKADRSGRTARSCGYRRFSWSALLSLRRRGSRPRHVGQARAGRASDHQPRAAADKLNKCIRRGWWSRGGSNP